MDEKIVRQSVNALCAYFRQRYPEDVSDISVENEEDECRVCFKIGTVIDASWTLKKNDMFVLARVDAVLSSLNEEDIVELRSELLEYMGKHVSAPISNNSLTMQKYFGFASEEGEEHTVRRIFDESVAFYLPVIRMKDRFAQKKENLADTMKEYAGHNEDSEDPYGFDSLIPDEDMLEGSGVRQEYSDAEDAKTEPSISDEDVLSLDTSLSGAIGDHPAGIAKHPERTSRPLGVLQGQDAAQPKEAQTERNRVPRKKRTRAKSKKRPAAPSNSGNTAETSVSDDDVYAQLEALSADVSATKYDPDAIKPSEDDDDIGGVLSVLEAEDAGENDLSKTASEIRSSLNDVFETVIPQARDLAMKSADEFAELATNISVREQEVHAREVLLQQNQEDWRRRNEELKKKEEQIGEISGKYDQAVAENQEKDEKIRQLSDDLLSVTHKAEDAEKRLKEITEEQTSGTAGQAYLKQLRQKLAYREDFINELQKKLNTSIEISEKLRDRMQDTASEAVAKAEEKWEEKENEYKLQIKELENRSEETSSVGAASDPEETRRLRDKLEEEEEQIRSLNDEKNLLRLNMEEARNERDSLAERLNASQAEVEQLQKEDDVGAIAAEVRDDLIRMSDNEFEPLPGESEMVIHGNYGSGSDFCNISFDAKERILFITHPLKNYRRAEDEVEELNQQDIRTSYDIARDETTGKVNLTCKAFCFDYHKAAKLALDVVNKMILIND